MRRIESLTKIKEKIIDKLVTVKNIEKTASNLTFKGSILKNFFHYAFKKPINIENLNSIEDLFLVNETVNIPKLILLKLYLLTPIALIFSFFTILNLTFLVMLLFIALLSSAFIAERKIKQLTYNYDIKKKFNIKNINQIKKTLLEKHNEEEIRSLIEGKLNKEELIEIFKEINMSVSEDYILKIFEKLGFNKENKEISAPYVLLLILEELIKDIKSESKETNLNLILNKKLIKSLIIEEDDKEMMEKSIVNL